MSEPATVGNSAGPGTAIALRFRDFGLAYSGAGRSERHIVQGVDLDVPAGGVYLLVGPSGSGKSTLLKTLTNLWETREPMPRLSGELQLLGHSIRHRYPPQLRGKVQAVLQDEGLLDELTPRRNVELALRRAGRSKRLALGLLSQAGLEPAPATVAELSGGMRKRLAVARSLAGEPGLLIFDEPTAGLDADSARDIAQLILSTQREASDQRTTLVITHDLSAFEDLADGVLMLDPSTTALRLVDPGTPVPKFKPSLVAGADKQGYGFVDSVSHGVRRALLELAALATTLYDCVVHAVPVFPVLALRTLGRYIIEPAFFIAIGCATVGGLATFFALRNNPLEGAFTASVITGSGKVLIAVLIPLLAGFFFTARVAAGAAARLGTMKRTSQVAALRVLGVSPADYLLIPLVFASSLAMPIATFCGLIMTCVASCLAAYLVAGISPFSWGQAFFAEVQAEDFKFLILKTVLSGFLVAVQTYHLAMGPKRSGREVGQSVNAAIVLGIYSVLAIHAIFTLVQFG